MAEAARLRGEKLGMERGMKRGLERSRIELVVSNLKRGKTYEQIADFLGISVDEAQQLEQKSLSPA